jgi:Kyakuja-Dileera-Zisupton transposase
MDYLVIWTLTIDGPIWVVISYDIACQWSINFPQRCERYGPELDPFEKGKIFTFLVPKFHLPAHILTCQVSYSFNNEPGVGRTEGEAPERGWSDSNGLAYSTREMGPGSRRDTLDDHFAAVNWAKVSKLGR